MPLTEALTAFAQASACPFRPGCPGGSGPDHDRGNSAAYLVRNYHDQENLPRSGRARRVGGAHQATEVPHAAHKLTALAYYLLAFRDHGPTSAIRVIPRDPAARCGTRFCDARSRRQARGGRRPRESLTARPVLAPGCPLVRRPLVPHMVCDGGGRIRLRHGAGGPMSGRAPGQWWP
jgi:hypothetical protein